MYQYLYVLATVILLFLIAKLFADTNEIEEISSTSEEEDDGIKIFFNTKLLDEDADSGKFDKLCENIDTSKLSNEMQTELQKELNSQETISTQKNSNNDTFDSNESVNTEWVYMPEESEYCASAKKPYQTVYRPTQYVYSIEPKKVKKCAVECISTQTLKSIDSCFQLFYIERKKALIEELRCSMVAFSELDLPSLYFEFKKQRRNRYSDGYWQHPDSLIKMMLKSGMGLGMVLNIVKQIFKTVLKIDEEECMLISMILCTFGDFEFQAITYEMLNTINANCQYNVNKHDIGIFRIDDDDNLKIKNSIEKMFLQCVFEIKPYYCTFDNIIQRFRKKYDQNINDKLVLCPTHQEMIEELTEYITFNVIINPVCLDATSTYVYDGIAMDTRGKCLHNCPKANLYSKYIFKIQKPITFDRNVATGYEILSCLSSKKHKNIYKALDEKSKYKIIMERILMLHKDNDLEMKKSKNIDNHNFLRDDYQRLTDKQKLIYLQQHISAKKFIGLVSNVNLENVAVLKPEIEIQSYLYGQVEFQPKYNLNLVDDSVINDITSKNIKIHSLMWDRLLEYFEDFLFTRLKKIWQIEREIVHDYIRIHSLRHTGTKRILKTLINTYYDGERFSNLSEFMSKVHILVVAKMIKDFSSVHIAESILFSD